MGRDNLHILAKGSGRNVPDVWNVYRRTYRAVTTSFAILIWSGSYQVRGGSQAYSPPLQQQLPGSADRRHLQVEPCLWRIFEVPSMVRKIRRSVNRGGMESLKA